MSPGSKLDRALLLPRWLRVDKSIQSRACVSDAGKRGGLLSRARMPFTPLGVAARDMRSLPGVKPWGSAFTWGSCNNKFAFLRSCREPVRELQGAAFRTAPGQVQGSATQAMWRHRRGAPAPQRPPPLFAHFRVARGLPSDRISALGSWAWEPAAKCEVVFARALWTSALEELDRFSAEPAHPAIAGHSCPLPSV